MNQVHLIPFDEIYSHLLSKWFYYFVLDHSSISYKL